MCEHVCTSELFGVRMIVTHGAFKKLCNFDCISYITDMWVVLVYRNVYFYELNGEVDILGNAAFLHLAIN